MIEIVAAAAAGLAVAPSLDNATLPVGTSSDTRPVLSWATRNPTFDLALSAALAALTWALSPNLPTIIYLASATTIATAALIDHRTCRLPNAITLPLAAFIAASIAAYAVASPDTAATYFPLSALVGAATALITLLLPHLAAPTQLGRGDVKLAPSLGALIGWPQPTIIEAIFYTSLAVLVSLALFLLSAAISKRGERSSVAPLGPALAAAALATIVASVS